MKIFASLSPADPLYLAATISRLETAGLDGLHIDFADGRFTPALEGGLDMLRAVRSATRLPIAVHLMLVEPERWIGPVQAAGADRVSVHIEASPYPWRLRAIARRRNIEFGLAINPTTPLGVLESVAEVPDFVSLLTTEPDDLGEFFLPGMLPRIAAARRSLPESVEIEIDGGVTREVCKTAIAGGVGAVVAGRALLNTSNWKQAVDEFRGTTLRRVG